eukprot:COSAG02_NODE_50370_length_321_cov_0.486486_1_plen_30_part_01
MCALAEILKRWRRQLRLTTLLLLLLLLLLL